MPLPDPIPEPNFVALREKFRALREERGLTYDALAERTGLNRRNIVALATGEARNGNAAEGSLASWWKLAKALDVDLAELLSALDS